MKRTLIVIAAVSLVGSAFAQNLYSNQSANVNQVALFSSSTSASGANAPAGAFFNELQSDGAAAPNTVLNTSAGSSVYLGTAPTGFRLADDFTITDPSWNVTGVSVFAYATGAAPGWMTGGDLNIWSGRPGDAGSSIVWSSGALTSSQIATNLNIASSAGTGAHYRIFNSNPGTSAPGTTRQINEFTFSLPSLSLAAGSYWIDYQLVRTANGVIFNPNTTHRDVRGVAGANARQFIASTGVWQDVLDAGILPPAPNNLGTLTSVNQDLPFYIQGEAVPEPATMTLLGLGAAALVARRRKQK